MMGRNYNEGRKTPVNREVAMKELLNVVSMNYKSQDMIQIAHLKILRESKGGVEMAVARSYSVLSSFVD